MQNNKEAIFVTGGTGLLGKRIVSRLCRSRYRVRVLSRQGRAVQDSSIEMIKGDILDKEIVEEAMIGCFAVFHCAAELRNSNRMYDVNVLGTNNAHNAARKNKINYFCHVSSVGVIGKTKKRIVDEDTPCNPMNEYEITKLKAEQIVEQGIDGCNTVILRPANIFAEESINPDSYNSLFSMLKTWLKGRENAHLVYADDVAAAAVYFLKNPLKSGCEKFIVSSDEEPGNTIGEVHNLIKKLLGVTRNNGKYFIPIIFPYFIRLLRHGKSNKGNICYSSRRLFSTGFEMPFGLEKGIKKAIEDKQKGMKRKTQTESPGL